VGLEGTNKYVVDLLPEIQGLGGSTSPQHEVRKVTFEITVTL
jgi:hypothetical protein